MFRPFLSAVFLLAGFLTARAAEPHPSLPPPVIPDCFGVNIHFTDPKPGELEMLAAAGFKWVRMDFGWGGTERKKGEYDFSAYDRLVTALDKFKIRAVFILDYGNPLYADPGDKQYFTSRAHTPEFREAFGKWAVAAVQHFKGRGYLWEMWNEPNGGFWKSPDKIGDYIALAKSTGEALRHAGLTGPKGEAYIGPATSTIDLPYLEACFKAGLLDYWDAVSVHPYRQSAPETVEDEYRSLRLLIRKYGPKGKVIPIVSGEWGYSSAWPGMGKDEAARVELQGKYLPRQFLTNMANDVTLSIWYDWHEDGTDPKEAEHHFGIVGNAYHAGRDPVYDPKPAYVAIQTLLQELSGMRLRQVHWFKGDNALLFEGSEQFRLVGWDLGHGRTGFENYLDFGKPRLIPLPIDKNPPTIRSIDGRPVPLIVAPNTPAQVQALREYAGWGQLPLEVVIHAPGTATFELKATNPFTHKTAIGFEGLAFGLPASSQQTAEWRLRPSDGVFSLVDRATVVAPGESRKSVVSLSVPSRFSRPEFRAFLGTSAELGANPGLMQRCLIVVENPLSLELLPFGPVAGVHITNPSGEPTRLTLRVSNDGLLNRARERKEAIEPLVAQVDVSLAEGEKQKDAMFAMPGTWSKFPEGTEWVASTDPSSNTFELKLNRQLSALDVNADLAALVEAVADGDSKVAAETRIGPEDPGTGLCPSQTHNVHLRYRFGAGWRFAEVRLRKAVEYRMPFQVHPLQKLGLWLYGDGQGCQARLRFQDSTGQTFQPDGPRIDWTGWRYITFPMQSTEEKPLWHWGGANDGVIHYPVKWGTMLLLDNAARQPVEGDIYLSAPTLIY